MLDQPSVGEFLMQEVLNNKAFCVVPFFGQKPADVHQWTLKTCTLYILNNDAETYHSILK